MLNLCVSFIVILFSLTHVQNERIEKYELWMDQFNSTSILLEGPASNEGPICEAEIIRFNKKADELNLRDIPCNVKVVSIIADDIGLKEFKRISIKIMANSVKNLTIVRNNIKQLDENVFSNSTLQHVNLTANEIVNIAPSAFDYMRELTQLILDHNELTTFNFSFVDCLKLKLISVRYNFIKSIEEGALKPLKLNVLTILLSYNNIRDVHKSAMDVKQFHEVKIDHNELTNAQLLIKLTKADMVDLSYNNITCLPKEFMENGLSKIKVLNLTGNPLECNCLNDLQKKVKKNIEFQKMSPLVQNINIVLPVLPKNDNKTC